MKLEELAARIGGVVEGDCPSAITGMAGLDDAGPGDISFLANPKYASAVAATKASAVIVGNDWVGQAPCALVRVKDPDGAFGALATLLGPAPVTPPPGVHPTAVVAPDASIGEGASIGPWCVLEPGSRVGARSILFAGCYIGHGSSVGDDCRLYPHVSLRERVTVGNRAIVHNGAVIGSDGFGYAREATGWRKIPQIGVVVVGDDVEIGANTTIDRARFGKTVLGNGVKLDNLVQIAHNVKIGANTAMAAQVGIAGSVEIGKNCMFGGQSGAVGHLTVGDGCIVAAKSGVSKDTPGGMYVSGFPAMPHDKASKIHAHTMRLPELKKKVAALEARLAALEAKKQ